MTIDEAIKCAEEIAEYNQKVVDTHRFADMLTIEEIYCDDTEKIEECLAVSQERAEDFRQLAEWLKELKKLKEQQPYEDAISREQALKELNWLDLESDYYGEKVEEMLNSLPSVTPKRKKGKWIFAELTFDGCVMECSCCHKRWKTYDEISWRKENKYCPSCGAEMEDAE